MTQRLAVPHLITCYLLQSQLCITADELHEVWIPLSVMFTPHRMTRHVTSLSAATVRSLLSEGLLDTVISSQQVQHLPLWMPSACFMTQKAWDACTCPRTAFLDSIVRLIAL